VVDAEPGEAVRRLQSAGTAADDDDAVVAGREGSLGCLSR
jgi:hypothetical protein